MWVGGQEACFGGAACPSRATWPAVLCMPRRGSRAHPPLAPPPPQAAKNAVKPQGGRCIWKTTTADRPGLVGRDRDAEAIAHARAHGWALMDAYAATRAAMALEPQPFVDNVHYVGYVYAELNQLLLNMICPLSVGASTSPEDA